MVEPTRESSHKDVSLMTKGRATIVAEGAALMSELSKHLWVAGKKFRVTIDCDPEANKFEITREDFN